MDLCTLAFGVEDLDIDRPMSITQSSSMTAENSVTWRRHRYLAIKLVNFVTSGFFGEMNPVFRHRAEGFRYRDEYRESQKQKKN